MPGTANPALISAGPEPASLTPPAPLGLFALGSTLTFLILQQRGWLNLEPWLMIVLVLYGSAALIIIGLIEYRQRSLLGALAFGCGGLFCLSQIALEVLPRAGFGQLPSPISLAAYLGLWALFGSILCVGARPLSLAIQGVFVLFTLHLCLHSFALVLGRPPLALAADLFGLASALCAGYCSLAICLNDSRGRNVLPLGARPPDQSRPKAAR